VVLFTRELYRLLGIQLAFSIAWHLKTNRQIEHVDQELNQYLCLSINEKQDNWYDLLLMAEFQHNNHIYASTQQTLFLLNTGCTLHMGFKPRQWPSRLKMVNEFTEQIKAIVKEVKSPIQKAQENIMRYYNQRKSLVLVFYPGDWIFLDISNIKTTRSSPKLFYHCLGPFIVEHQVRLLAYCLKLPHTIKKLYLVFNIVKLSTTLDDLILGQRLEPPPPPIIVNRKKK